MSKVITNSFTLTALRDGSNYHGVIKLRDANNPLLQFINTSDNSISPNWKGSNATKVPEFYLEVRDQTGALVPYTSEKVYYGGDSEDGKYTEATGEDNVENGVTMPYYKFIENPASPSNTDDDFFYMKANITVSSGVVVPITSDIRTVQIRATSGGAAYLMEVSSKNIEKNETVGFVRASIYNSNSVSQDVSYFSYSWYNITGSEPIQIQHGNGYEIDKNLLTVHKDKINGHDTFMCIAKKDKEPNIGMEVMGTGGISDFSDPYTCELHITNDKGAAGTVIRKGETYTVTPKVYQTKSDSNGTPIKEEMTNATVTLSFFNNNGALTPWDEDDENVGTYKLSYDTVVNTFGGQVRIDVSNISFN